MEWNEKLQLIIDYVENHLQRKEEAVVSEEISKTAGCSFAFFKMSVSVTVCLLILFQLIQQHLKGYSVCSEIMIINVMKLNILLWLCLIKSASWLF